MQTEVLSGIILQYSIPVHTIPVLHRIRNNMGDSTVNRVDRKHRVSYIMTAYHTVFFRYIILPSFFMVQYPSSYRQPPRPKCRSKTSQSFRMIFSPSAHQRFDIWHQHVPHDFRQYSRPYRSCNGGLRMNIDSFAGMNSLPDSGSSIMICSTQSIIPTIVDTFSNIVISLTSYAANIASMVLRLSIRFQDVGETLLTAFLILSLLQAGVALYQVRYSSVKKFTYSFDVCVKIMVRSTHNQFYFSSSIDMTSGDSLSSQMDPLSAWRIILLTMNAADPTLHLHPRTHQKIETKKKLKPKKT